MILYHYSKEKFDKLKPVIGLSRHSGEDDKAIKKPVVWLTNGSSDLTYENGKVVAIYQHEVEIDENDPNLFIDEKKEQLDSQMEKLFETRGSKWYFYTKELIVKKIRIWDEKSNSFV